MDQYFNSRVDEFEKHIRPFLPIWKSVVMRVGWFLHEGIPRPLAISIHLAAQKPSDVVFSNNPATGAFQVSCEARGIADLPALLQTIRNGTIDVQGTKLKLEHHQGSQWKEIGSPFVNFERPGIVAWRDQAYALAYMRQFESINDTVYEPVRDMVIQEAWRALPAPFWDRNDVLNNFFQIEGAQQQDQVVFFMGADVPPITGPRPR